jgi:hypothetical protein
MFQRHGKVQDFAPRARNATPICHAATLNRHLRYPKPSPQSAILVIVDGRAQDTFVWLTLKRKCEVKIHAAGLIVATAGFGGIVCVGGDPDTGRLDPKCEQAQRDPYGNSEAYNRDTIEELQNLRVQFAQARPYQRDALALLILHLAAQVDESALPGDLRAFIGQARTTRRE